MSWAEKIAGAQESGGKQARIMQGEYTLIVKNLGRKTGHKGESLVLEFVVDEAKSVCDEVSPNKVGTTCAYVMNLTKNQYAAGNAKSFFRGLLGDEGMSDEDLVGVIESAVEPDQPFRGLRVKCSTYVTEIKTGPNAGKPFVGYNWELIPDQSDEMIDAAIAALDL